MTCCVEQGKYGHRARKATWLYVYGFKVPQLAWGPSSAETRLMDDGFHSAEERRRAKEAGFVHMERLSNRERAASPIEFRDLLLGMARSVELREAA